MKVLIFLLTLASFVFAQQMNHTSGFKTSSGDSWGNEGITFIDTTTGTTNDIIIKLNDWYPGFDINPYNDTSGVVLLNSNLFYIGTFYVSFDNQGITAPTTDSLLYTIKAYAGMYNSSDKTIANIKWHGTAVTLETVATVNDYMAINDVYVHATKYKHYPPEVIKLEIAPSGSSGCDDSTAVDWNFTYPQIYQTDRERNQTED